MTSRASRGKRPPSDLLVDLKNTGLGIHHIAPEAPNCGCGDKLLLLDIMIWDCPASVFKNKAVQHRISTAEHEHKYKVSSNTSAAEEKWKGSITNYRNQP